LSQDISIRPALPADALVLHELIVELAIFEKAPDAVINTPQAIEKHGWGPNPLFVAWIAELAGTPVGMALCYFRYSTWKGPVLYLEDLIVKEPYRGRGAGKLLFETCLNYAKENQFSRMSWQVLDWNQEAIDFYRNYGADFDPEWVNCSIDIRHESLE
jgi:GNAT superfamily N-acetyltransferase